MITRIYVTMEKEERQALGQLAAREMRDVREQARFILRQELERRGLLQGVQVATDPAGQGGSDSTHEQIQPNCSPGEQSVHHVNRSRSLKEKTGGGGFSSEHWTAMLEESSQLNPQARAARVTAALLTKGALTTKEIHRLSGIQSHPGILHLMKNIATVLPIKKPGYGKWVLDAQQTGDS